MASRKTKQRKEPLVVRSFTLTPTLDQMLQRLSQEASDHTGWTVSTSAIVRALLRYVEQQPDTWALSYLFPLVEQELNAGVIWGSKKK
jgi:inactivated superfamily I helicase